MRNLIACAGLCLVAACASGPTPANGGAQQAAANCQDVPDTGTRVLRKCSNPNMVRAIGSATAQDDASRVQSLSNVTGARGN